MFRPLPYAPMVRRVVVSLQAVLLLGSGSGFRDLSLSLGTQRSGAVLVTSGSALAPGLGRPLQVSRVSRSLRCLRFVVTVRLSQGGLLGILCAFL